MLDDIIEAAIDILDDVVELIVSAKRRKKKSGNKSKAAASQEPWEHSDQPVPWEKK